MRAVIEAVGIDDPPADLVRSCATAMFEFTRDGIDLYDDVAADPRRAPRRAASAPRSISNCDHFGAPRRRPPRARATGSTPCSCRSRSGAKKPRPGDLRGGARGDRRRRRRATPCSSTTRPRTATARATLGIATRLIVRPGAVAARGSVGRGERPRGDRGPALRSRRLGDSVAVAACPRRCTSAGPGPRRTGSRRHRSRSVSSRIPNAVGLPADERVGARVEVPEPVEVAPARARDELHDAALGVEAPLLVHRHPPRVVVVVTRQQQVGALAVEQVPERLGSAAARTPGSSRPSGTSASPTAGGASTRACTRPDARRGRRRATRTASDPGSQSTPPAEQIVESSDTTCHEPRSYE